MQETYAAKSYHSIYVRYFYSTLIAYNILTLLDQKLGIEIHPSDVRTNPKRKDPYSWRVLCGREDFFFQIFSKNLSDHSISTYRLLIDEVGKTFEAVISTDASDSLGALTPVCIDDSKQPQYLCIAKTYVVVNS